MQYTSTRDSRLSVESSVAIAHGISVEGGLFVPQTLPILSLKEIETLAAMEYPARAAHILGMFLTDFTAEELEDATECAYTEGVFEDDWVAPLADLSDGRYVLELWHGPTCAFKDMALQLLPRLLGPAARRALGGQQMMILVATSGDTGKAALEGFHDVPGIKIAVFYPEDGVSPMQKMQMATQLGQNVEVFAIKGNFDLAQSGVKQIFTDPIVIQALSDANTVLSSANSINWGRLVPQIVYYFSAYADLVGSGDITLGDKINFVVPTGNFGNILAGYYAMKMGLPIGKLICASNRNNVLTDFMRDGIYDANRAFYQTLSPSMDILISSNLERLLFELSEHDDQAVAGMMQKLTTDRRYEITPALRQTLQASFWGGYAEDARCKKTIGDTYEQLGYLVDPHTAVALAVYEDYKRETGDPTRSVIVSTADPYKFSHSVLTALRSDAAPQDEFEALTQLSALTEVEPPESLAKLRGAPIRFTRVLAPEEMSKATMAFALGCE